jgi:endonuclease YncB( thermonuclease family)
MFGWWRKNEGFEWREYVRTTILVRRKRRQDRIDEAKVAAVAGLKQAGRVGAEAGARGAAGLGQIAARSGRKAGRLLIDGLAVVGRTPGQLARRLRPALIPVAAAVSVPNLRGPLLVIGLLGLAGAAVRAAMVGFDTEATIAAGLGLAGLALGILPLLAERPPGGAASRVADRMARLPGLPGLHPAFGGLLIVVGGVGVAWLAATRMLQPGIASSLLSSLPLAASKPIEGRGAAVTGDTLRVGSVVVRLAGIEAPEADQRCGASGRKSWRCGEAATEGLGKIVRGKLVSCTLSGSGEAGRPLATCRTEGIDVATTLVRQGHVFAQQGVLARYASTEIEARTAKAGLWKGDAQRPLEWRAKRWEEAKRAAPDGCPIKGAVGNDGKVYVLPWSREYERVKIKSARGERWFCSEQEARSAGWRLAERS